MTAAAEGLRPNSRRALTDEQRDLACTLREQGWSCERIAHHFRSRGTRVHRSSIAWLCLIEGADLPIARRKQQCAPPPGIITRRGNHSFRTFTPEEDARLLALEAEGKNYSVIGRALGRKPNSIRGRLATLARRDARSSAALGIE